jgi:hypothetical protein
MYLKVVKTNKKEKNWEKQTGHKIKNPESK